ncbi:NADP oxidoreductase [Acidobacteria bacterium Mor1]|nr:NADP oxidoreductase [Acidobacteria bacterium Mor1]
MSQPGSPERPLRVAIVGSGPTGFYAAQHLFDQDGLTVEVDMFDRLPTPYGLVRLGVAPDHQKIKKVIAVYARTAANERFRFFGNVELGRDIQVEDLRRHYDQVVYCTGSPSDRRLGIPGEDLDGSYTATEFVAWYNGHPDYADAGFDLSREAAVIVGVGNVAVDVARVLCRTHEELAATDIADYALEALRESKVRRVYVLGRRGPAQAAFTNTEIKELGELPRAECSVLPEEMQLDELTREALEANPDKMTTRKLDILNGLAGRSEPEKESKLQIRFLVSPVEIEGNDAGQVSAVRIERNRLEGASGGRTRAVGTGEFETLEAGLVFRSVGYRGVALPGVPFRDDWAIIPNDAGRVQESTDGPLRPGEYVAGWAKRGPSGVIGTNKPDALETVQCMVEDVAAGKTLSPESPTAEAIDGLLAERQPRVFRFDDWKQLDALETAAGEKSARPRVKFTDIDAMWSALDKG